MRMILAHRTASALLIATLALPGIGMAQPVPGQTAPKSSPQATPAGTTAPVATPAAPATKTATAKPVPKRVTAADRVEQRITQLHSELKITADQQPQWDQFTAVMRANASATTQAYIDRSTKVSTMNAADNMSSYAALTMQHAQDMQKLATAFQSLYTALTPDQQKTADQVFRGPAARRR